MQRYTSNQTDANILSRPLDLPSGAQLKNRIVKAAMSDSLGDGAGHPTRAQMRLYERWAEGGSALSLIGEVQVSSKYPEKPGNLVFSPDADAERMAELAQRGSADGVHIWPQLGHAGALSYAPVSAPKGPSPLQVEGLSCEGMTLQEVQALPSLYAQAAKLAQRCGFGGVQVHAGHGFLLSQFLSPLFNHRRDAYGGDIKNRFRVIAEILEAVRAAVGPSFPIAIKINATDKLDGGLTPEDGLDVVRMLDGSGVDLIDVSGGTYFPGAPASSDGTADSGPYFVKFAAMAKEITTVPIMLTGGVRTRAQAAQVVREGAADAVGIARGFVVNPHLAHDWMREAGGDPVFPVFEAPPRGGITAWYSMRLTALGEDREAQFDWNLEKALAEYDARDEARVAPWRARFGSD